MTFKGLLEKIRRIRGGDVGFYSVGVRFTRFSSGKVQILYSIIDHEIRPFQCLEAATIDELLTRYTSLHDEESEKKTHLDVENMGEIDFSLLDFQIDQLRDRQRGC